MAFKNDWIGVKKGRLTVIKRLPNEHTPNGTTKVMWLCKCDCGSHVKRDSSSLKNTDFPSCGCARRERMSDIKTEDLSGKRFGRLVVISKDKKYGDGSIWKCKCDCGKEKHVRAGNLKSGHTKSCGCLNSDCIRDRSLVHGMKNSRVYRIWSEMKDRCTNPNSSNRQNYYDRGITICDEWMNSPLSFIEWAYNSGYTDDLSIDRIDNDKGYSPTNCRWVTAKEQARNKRNNLYITYKGKTQPLSAWCEELNLNYDRIWARIRVLNWDINRAFTV